MTRARRCTRPRAEARRSDTDPDAVVHGDDAPDAGVRHRGGNGDLHHPRCGRAVSPRRSFGRALVARARVKAAPVWVSRVTRCSTSSRRATRRWCCSSSPRRRATSRHDDRRVWIRFGDTPWVTRTRALRPRCLQAWRIRVRARINDQKNSNGGAETARFAPRASGVRTASGGRTRLVNGLGTVPCNERVPRSFQSTAAIVQMKRPTAVEDQRLFGAFPCCFRQFGSSQSLMYRC